MDRIRILLQLTADYFILLSIYHLLLANLE
jgi:hypothetical protein